MSVPVVDHQRARVAAAARTMTVVATPQIQQERSRHQTRSTVPANDNDVQLQNIISSKEVKRFKWIPYVHHLTNVEVRATIGCRRDHRQTLASLRSYCPQLTATESVITTALLLRSSGNELPTGSDRQ